MRKKDSHIKFRLDRASELRQFHRIIKNSGICRNANIIEEAAQTLIEMNKTSDKKNWGYEIIGLIFDFKSTPRNTKPQNARSIKLKLDLKVKGTIENCEQIKDPFDELQFDMVIYGTNNSNSELICAYHLDRDLGNNGGTTEAIHPVYHFQFGGHKLDYNRYTFGQLIMLESPRIAHYPMELILGLDFIMSNYFHRQWQVLREDGEYAGLIKKYADLFLKPYVKSLNYAWEHDKNQVEWDYLEIWPHLS